MRWYDECQEVSEGRHGHEDHYVRLRKKTKGGWVALCDQYPKSWTCHVKNTDEPGDIVFIEDQMRVICRLLKDGIEAGGLRLRRDHIGAPWRALWEGESTAEVNDMYVTREQVNAIMLMTCDKRCAWRVNLDPDVFGGSNSPWRRNGALKCHEHAGWSQILRLPEGGQSIGSWCWDGLTDAKFGRNRVDYLGGWLVATVVASLAFWSWLTWARYPGIGITLAIIAGGIAAISLIALLAANTGGGDY